MDFFTDSYYLHFFHPHKVHMWNHFGHKEPYIYLCYICILFRAYQSTDLKIYNAAIPNHILTTASSPCRHCSQLRFEPMG